VELVIEPEPRGNAGTVAAHRAFAGSEESVWILYSDNLTDIAMAPLLEAHRRHQGLLTLGVFRAPDPTAAGIVETAADGRVLSFEEKPRQPKSNLANAGVYLARRALLDKLPVSSGILDFGHDVFPRLLGEIYAWPVQGFLMDIGTPAALARASEAWAMRQQAVAP
jgi:mannose-1-phosphate guanylyltransferase